MLNQLTELEEITLRLEQITSIFNIMCESYFKDAEPNEYHLKTGYTDYTNVIDVIRIMVHQQGKNLHDATKDLYKGYWELDKIPNGNILALEGGAAND